MPNRLSQALSAARQAVASEAGPTSRAEPQSADFADLGSIKAVLALGHRKEDPAQLALAIARPDRPEGPAVLLITDDSRVVERRVPGLVCEYLPPAADLAETTGDGPDVVQHYLQRRLLSVLEKWLVTECHWIGGEAEDLVAAVQSDIGPSATAFHAYSGQPRASDPAPA